MIVRKEELLPDLQKFLSFEDELEAKLADFYLSLDWRQTIDPKYHQEIE
jgi:hypothetical protein